MSDPAEDVLAGYVLYRIFRAFIRFWWRFFTGQPLDGKARTRSSFLYGSDVSLKTSQRASKWEKKPGWARAGWRLYWMIFLSVLSWGMLFHRFATELALAITAVLVVGYAAAHANQWARTRSFRRDVVNPFAAAVGRAVGHANAIKPSEWVHLDKDYRKPGHTVTADLPADFQPTQDVQDRVEEVAAAKFGGKWEATFDVDGVPALILEHAPEPPAHVGWPGIRAYLQAATVAAPFIGLGSRDRPFHLDFRGETPHIYASIPNGLGKTVLARLLAAQVLHDGGRVVILDSVKKQSHDWAYVPTPLPGVTYCRDPADVHWALLKLQDEVAGRYDAPDPERLPQILTIVEDAVAIADQLQALWRTQLGKGNTLVRSPAVMAMQEVFYVGRQCNANAALFANKATSAAFGGSNGAAARENATPILSPMSSPATWKLLVDIDNPPAQEKIPGRVWVVNAGELQAVQVGELTNEQARFWATSGEDQPPAKPEVDELPGWLAESSLPENAGSNRG